MTLPGAHANLNARFSACLSDRQVQLGFAAIRRSRQRSREVFVSGAEVVFQWSSSGSKLRNQRVSSALLFRHPSVRAGCRDTRSLTSLYSSIAPRWPGARTLRAARYLRAASCRLKRHAHFSASPSQAGNYLPQFCDRLVQLRFW